jgi:excisionase family DNA binding protein
MMSDRLFAGRRVEEVAAALGVGRRLIFKEIAEGRLCKTKIGRRTVITDDAVREWLDLCGPGRQRQQPATRAQKAKKAAPLVLADDLPVWLPAAVWDEWRQHRKGIRKPLTATSTKLTLKKLADLRAGGHEPRTVIEQSIANGWTGLFALKDQPGAKPYRNGFIAAAERLARDEAKQSAPEANPFLTGEVGHAR